MVHCAVRGCSNESFVGCLLSSYSFPKDNTKKRKWLVRHSSLVPKNVRLCRKHFRNRKDFKFDIAQRNFYKQNASPSIFLGEKVPTEGLHGIETADCNKRTLELNVSSMSPINKKSQKIMYLKTQPGKPNLSKLQEDDKDMQINTRKMNIKSITKQTAIEVVSDEKLIFETVITEVEILLKQILEKTK